MKTNKVKFTDEQKTLLFQLDFEVSKVETLVDYADEMKNLDCKKFVGDLYNEWYTLRETYDTLVEVFGINMDKLSKEVIEKAVKTKPNATKK